MGNLSVTPALFLQHTSIQLQWLKLQQDGLWFGDKDKQVDDPSLRQLVARYSSQISSSSGNYIKVSRTNQKSLLDLQYVPKEILFLCQNFNLGTMFHTFEKNVKIQTAERIHTSSMLLLTNGLSGSPHAVMSSEPRFTTTSNSSCNPSISSLIA